MAEDGAKGAESPADTQKVAPVRRLLGGTVNTGLSRAFATRR